MSTPGSVQPTCPFCRSTEVVTNKKKNSPSPYSRCDGCGAVWHPDRMPAVHAGGRVDR